MRAAIVLLADYKTQNLARRMAVELEQGYQVAFMASLLPAHISLKQPFAFEDMGKLEGYFDSLAAETAPVQITLEEIYCSDWLGYGILGMTVKETSALRDLHNRLNRELSRLFKDTSAPHDGDEYRFHLTIEMGETEEFINPYRTYFESLVTTRLDSTFLAEYAAIFYYPGEDLQSFINYKILPLTG